MPKGINADGSPKKRPVNSGRKLKEGSKKKGPYRFSSDVVAILEALPKEVSATEWIEDAIRLKSSTQ